MLSDRRREDSRSRGHRRSKDERVKTIVRVSNRIWGENVRPIDTRRQREARSTQDGQAGGGRSGEKTSDSRGAKPAVSTKDRD